MTRTSSYDRLVLAAGTFLLVLTAGCKTMEEKRNPSPQPSEPPATAQKAAAIPTAAATGVVTRTSYEQPVTAANQSLAATSSTATVSGGGSVNIKVSDPAKASASVQAMPSATSAGTKSLSASGSTASASPLSLPSEPESASTPWSAPTSSETATPIQVKAAASGSSSTQPETLPKTPPQPKEESEPVRILPPPGGEVPVTLHVDNVDIRKVLEMISRQANVSIIVSPGISGKVTGDFQGMPLSKALDVITRMHEAEVQNRDGIIFVSTIKEAREIESRNMPMRIYRLKYVRAKDLVDLIKPLLSSGGNAKTSVSPEAKTGLPNNTASVSQSGSIGSTADIQAGGNNDAGAEYLIVTDYEEVLKRVDAAIAEIDIQPIQVMIEAVIVQVKLLKGMDLGASFGIADSSGKALGVIGDGALINSANGGFSPQTAVSGTGVMNAGFLKDTYGLKYGFISNNVTGYIQALETGGEVKVLAAPRVWVLNKQAAQIHLGKMLGYSTTTTTTTSTSATVNYLSVGTQLRIRPFVNDDGMIRMEIHPERSSGAVDSNGIPQTTISQETSNIIMRSGQTMVMGGLIDNDVEQSWTGLPFLSRIPWLGYLFRHTSDSGEKDELVIILTPRICPRDNLVAFNGLGQPSTLGLRKRTLQNPVEEKRDGKNLYQLLEEQTRCKEATPPPTQKASACPQPTEPPCPQSAPAEKNS